MITVSRVNDNTPVAVGDTDSVAEGGTLVASVAGNDSDVDVGDTLTLRAGRRARRTAR